MIPITVVPQSKVPGSGDHPLLPQVEVLTSLSPLQVKVSGSTISDRRCVGDGHTNSSKRCGAYHCIDLKI